MTEDKIFQVSEFNEFISTYLEQVGEVVIEGELSEIKINQGKWVFATIKDKESNVDIFGLAFKLSGYDLLEPGMLVHVYGIPRLYKKTGRFSVFANRIVPAGEGALRLAFEKLKEKLEGEGLFAPQRKRQIPTFPEKIGLITADDSRAYGDFIKVLKHRMGGLKIFLYSVSVQGKDSASSVVRAFKYMNDSHPNLDALVLIRGGGSLEDLQSFNDEAVVRAIFASKIPVVCGVGHENDITISDLVSDIRASTPSNAAELLVRNRADVLAEINHYTKSITNCLENTLGDYNHKVINCVQSLEASIGRQASIIHRFIDRFISQFMILKQEVRELEHTRLSLLDKLGTVVNYWVKQQKDTIDSHLRLLNSFDVTNVLRRGFSITFGKDGKVLRTVKLISTGSQITTSLFDGKIGSQVLSINEK